MITENEQKDRGIQPSNNFSSNSLILIQDNQDKYSDNNEIERNSSLVKPIH